LRWIGYILGGGFLLAILLVGALVFWLARVPKLNVENIKELKLDDVAVVVAPESLQRARINSLQSLSSYSAVAPRLGDGPFGVATVHPGTINFALDFGGKTSLGGHYESALLLVISILEKPLDKMTPELFHGACSSLSDDTFWDTHYQDSNFAWKQKGVHWWEAGNLKNSKLGAIYWRKDKQVQVLALWKNGVGDRDSLQPMIERLAESLKVRRPLESHFQQARQQVASIRAEHKTHADELLKSLPGSQKVAGPQRLADNAVLLLKFPMFAPNDQPYEYSYAIKFPAIPRPFTQKLADKLRDLAKLGPGLQYLLVTAKQDGDDRMRLIFPEQSQGQDVGTGDDWAYDVIFEGWPEARSKDGLAFLATHGTFDRSADFDSVSTKLKAMRSSYK
jgi:hypothetical protein